LLLGHRKVWCWYYQLEEQRAHYQKQLEDAEEGFREQLAQLRADFSAQLAAAEKRAETWRDLVREGRTLVRQSVETAAELAKRHAV
jgi:ribosome recycling factor